MKHTKIIFQFVFYFICTSIMYSQNKKSESFLIVTFERSFSKGFHNNDSYFWIINNDSLKKNQKLSPLYISGFSKNSLNNCINDSIVYPFDTFKGDTFDFKKDYTSLQKRLPNLIESNRKLILTVNKKFNSKLKEKICIYITPVQGKFCSSRLDNASSKKINYYGKVYYPLKNITFLSSFDINSIDVFALQSKMNLGQVSNVPW